MLQKILNLKRLFQGNKSKIQTPMNTLYGSRCVFYVTNLALIGFVILLSIVSLSIYFFMPVTDVSDLSGNVEIREVNEATPDAESADVDSSQKGAPKDETYTIITEKNVFSPQRKEWVVKAIIPKPSELAKKDQAKQELAKKKALAVKPKKIILQGIVISGDIRKALINNPLTGVSNKKTLYVQEGDDLEGYKVTGIESDRIKLDWQGEEIIVPLYSGLNGSPLPEDPADKLNNGGVLKMEYTYEEVDDKRVDGSTGELQKRREGETAVEKSYADTLDEVPFNLMSMEPERRDGE